MDRERANPLGAYLRARRELAKPEHVGLTVSGIRRVPGLRREELAMLAGISADYYLRLERGRDRHPSAQVIESLARALDLDQDHLTHLTALASDSRPVAATTQDRSDIPVSAIQLLDGLEHAAFIEDRYFTVLAANSAAVSLNPRLAPGRNQLRDVLLDDEERAMHPDWESVASCLTAGLRYTAGSVAHDPAVAQLASELVRTSSDFRRLWARHDVRAQRGAALNLVHPQAGLLILNREQLSITGSDRLRLVIYSPVP